MDMSTDLALKCEAKEISIYNHTVAEKNTVISHHVQAQIQLTHTSGYIYARPSC